MKLSVEDRARAFMMIGFREDQIKNKNLSCPQCKEDKKASDCNIKEIEVTDSRRFKAKVVICCPDCDTEIIGGSVKKQEYENA